MIVDTRTAGAEQVRVTRKATGTPVGLVIEIDTEARMLKRLQVKAAQQGVEQVKLTMDDYEEVQESLDLFKVDNLPYPSERGYRAVWKEHDKNEEFWREVLEGKRIDDVVFDDQGVTALKLSDGQLVHIDTSGYRLCIKD